MQLKFPVYCLLLATCLAALNVNAQKDPGTLKCPFEHGSGKEPREAYTWEPRDEKVIMISKVDTVVLACIDATVSNVQLTEDNNYEIVMYYKNYYFWYYGVEKPMVKRGDKVKAGQPVGTYKFGTELEFRFYKDEDQKDPRDLLECKVPRADQ